MPLSYTTPCVETKAVNTTFKSPINTPTQNDYNHCHNWSVGRNVPNNLRIAHTIMSWKDLKFLFTNSECFRLSFY